MKQRGLSSVKEDRVTQYKGKKVIESRLLRGAPPCRYLPHITLGSWPEDKHKHSLHQQKVQTIPDPLPRTPSLPCLGPASASTCLNLPSPDLPTCA